MGWTTIERARLEDRYADALNRLASDAEKAGNHTAAVKWRRRLAEADTVSSRHALGFIRALVAAGDRTSVLQHARIYEALGYGPAFTSEHRRNQINSALSQVLQSTDAGRVAAVHIFFRLRKRRHQHAERRVRLSATALAAVQFLATSLESIQLGSDPISFRPEYRLGVIAARVVAERSCPAATRRAARRAKSLAATALMGAIAGLCAGGKREMNPQLRSDRREGYTGYQTRTRNRPCKGK